MPRKDCPALGAAPTKSLDDALSEIAALAKIPEDRRSDFCKLVRSAIDGVIHVKKLKGDDSTISKSRAVMRNARTLLADLKTMEKGSREGHGAGLFLRAAAMDRRVKIKNFIDPLELLAEVAEAAASDIARSNRSAAGRPPGTPGNLGFDFFVQQLLTDARAVGVKFTIFKSNPSRTPRRTTSSGSKADGGWNGSLLKTIELLRAHLPDDFVPKAGLGKRLDRIARRHRILLDKMDADREHPRNPLSR
jgi:hypothetical protein